MRAKIIIKKLLTSRQIFRYAIPSHKSTGCTESKTAASIRPRESIRIVAMFSTTTNVDTAQNRAADLPSSALVPFPASSRSAAANDAGFTVDESVPRVCVACSLPCQDSSSPRETAPAQANQRRSRGVGRVDKLHAAPE